MATYAINGTKIYRNGKLAANLEDDAVSVKRGYGKFKGEIEEFIANLEDEPEEKATQSEPEVTDTEAPTRKREGKQKETEAPEPLENQGFQETAAETKPEKILPKTEPEQSRQFGDLTPEVVYWRKENWPAKKFAETYHRRLRSFPDLEE